MERATTLSKERLPGFKGFKQVVLSKGWQARVGEGVERSVSSWGFFWGGEWKLSVQKRFLWKKNGLGLG